MKYNNFSG